MSLIRGRLVGVVLLLMLGVGCAKSDPGLEKVSGQLQQVLAQIAEAPRRQAPRRQAPSAAEIQAVFEPFQHALQRLSEAAQTDRQRWSQLAVEMRRLARVVEQSDNPAQKSELSAMRERIKTMESRLQQQSAQQAKEKQLMIGALEASTAKLEQMFQAMVGPKAAIKASTSNAGPGKGAKSVAPRTAEPDTGSEQPKTEEPQVGGGLSALFDKLDVGQVVLIFLTVSLLCLVAIVVFFPGRLRHTVPQIEYSAEPDSGDDTEIIPAPVSAAPEPISHSGNLASDNPIVSRPHRFPDPVVVDGNPVPHQLSLALEDKASLEKLVAMLDSYLNTEPYILRNPAPRVALVQGELQLQFYALPNLSKAEHALLDATVRRLRPQPVDKLNSEPTGAAPQRSSEASADVRAV